MYKDVYNKDNDKYREALKNKDWYFDNKNFWQELDKLNKENIFEIGCGSGLFIEEMVKIYKLTERNIELSDVSDFRVFNNYKFTKIDINYEKYPIEDGTKDLVLCLYTIEHLENPFNMLKEVERILKPGGVFVLGMPNGWNIFSRIMFLFSGRIERYHRPKTLHINFLPKNILWQFMNNFKLEWKINRDSYLIERLVNLLFHDFRSKFKVLNNIFKIKLPSNEFFSNDIIYFFKKIK